MIARSLVESLVLTGEPEATGSAAMLMVTSIMRTGGWRCYRGEGVLVLCEQFLRFGSESPTPTGIRHVRSGGILVAHETDGTLVRARLFLNGAVVASRTPAEGDELALYCDSNTAVRHGFPHDTYTRIQ